MTVEEHKWRDNVLPYIDLAPGEYSKVWDMPIRVLQARLRKQEQKLTDDLVEIHILLAEGEAFPQEGEGL